MVLGALAVGADLSGVLSAARVPNFVVYWSVAIAILAFSVTYFGDLKLFRLQERLKTRDEYVGGGLFAHREDDDSVTQYECSGRCVYPYCTGTIRIVDAPPRETYLAPFVGRCDSGGRLHSYRIDVNRVAAPAALDWREPEKRDTSSF